MVLVVMAGASGLALALTGVDRPATVTRVAERGSAAAFGEAPQPTTTPYGLPVSVEDGAAWHSTHAAYPATDVFAGCGAAIVSPVYGTITEVRRVDSWDPDVDNPATRGGRSVTVVGFDGVRYYFAHLDEIVPELAVGDRVALGDRLGSMGDTGRTSACHLHFGISPPCPDREWSVRRGVIWPYHFLEAWAQGNQVGPGPDVATWDAAHPDACAVAAADPFAPDA